MGMLSQHIRPAEAARVLSLHSGTVRAWIRSGKIRAAHVGRSVFVPETEVARLVADTSSRTCDEQQDGPRAGRIDHKGKAVRDVAAVLNRAGIHHVTIDYASMQRGYPTFLVLAKASGAPAARGLAIWIINGRKKPTQRQRELESLFLAWGYKTLFVFDAGECIEAIQGLGYMMDG